LDQRRFITFLMLSVAVLMLFSILFPAPPKPEKPPAAAADAQADGDAAPKGDVADADSNEGEPAEQPPGDDQVAAPAPAAVADVPQKFFTLGSLDPASGYRMLVTVSNTGGSVRRAEMTSARYRDQHDRSGYLGELELKSVEGGVEVQVVGAGTPAADAGIAVGDVITGIAGRQTIGIKTPKELATALSKTEPEKEITLLVRRGAAEAQPRKVKLNWRPFAVVRPEIENYWMRDAEPPADFEDPPSFLLTMSQVDGKPLSKTAAKRVAELLKEGNWEVTATSATSVAFRQVLPDQQLEIIKRYTLEPVPATERNNADFPAYDIQLDVELRNTADTPQTLAYQLDGPTGMPLEGWWYAHKISRERWFGGAGLRDVVGRFDGNPVFQEDCSEIAAGDAEPITSGQPLAYAGVDGQYFAAVMIPVRKALNEVWFDTAEAIVTGTPLPLRTPTTYTNVTCRLTRRPIELAAEATHRESYQVFMGPKRPELLAQYQAAGDPNHSLKDIVYYGLALFAFVARGMLWILHAFYSLVGNYGISIVMLTVLVRGLMFPISFRQTKNMARMQALKPEMDRITEKYKTDMQKRSQAIQELYRKHEINPLGGCLPVFLQLPIFIGLYRALMVDVELRLSPLFSETIRWCSNLAAPDMFWNWSRVIPDFITQGLGLGPYLNVLPLVTVALFLVTQKMAMPAPTNEQAAMQQKMMKWMTVFMGYLFYKVASGLCLYFIASSLWGIAERKLLPKATTPDTAAASGTGGSATGASGKRPGNGGKAGPNGSPSPKRPPKAKRRK
jgi:YidC/Oxa1 family membrane protein insertase